MRSLKRDDGNVAIIVALMMTTLFGVAALAIDAGMLYTRHDQVQAGADAAALAIAKECADLVVGGLTDCPVELVNDLAGDYLDANALGDVDLEALGLDAQHEGRAGRITVTGVSDEPSVFARFLGVDRQRTSATATARWGPMTAVDNTFFLALCRSDLLEPDTTDITLIAASPDDRRSGAEPPTDACTGAPGAAPFGFIPPEDTTRCTAPVTLLPSTWLDVTSSAPGYGEQCHGALHDLRDDIRATRSSCPSWWSSQQCDQHLEEGRTRTLAVYDASGGSPGAHPSYALVGFEFTAMRLDHLEYDGPGRWACEPYDDPDGVAREDVQCIRGRVKPHTPPEDGPIVDLDDLNVAGIPDTTVLDVRLVD